MKNSFYKTSKPCNNTKHLSSPTRIPSETSLMYSKLPIEILGWIGSILYLVAYVLVSAKRPKAIRFCIKA